MPKSQLTLDIEKALIKKFSNTSSRFSTEVAVQSFSGGKLKNGICDFVAARMNDQKGHHEITCFEIKVSLSDFKSKHGHSLFGDKNYYVLPKELYFEILEKDPNLIMGDFGIVCFNGSSLKIVRECVTTIYKSNIFKRKFSIKKKEDTKWTTQKKTYLNSSKNKTNLTTKQ